MFKRIKAFGLVICLILTAISLTSCGNKNKTNKTEIYFLNFKPEAADIYKSVAKDYEKETGVSVKVVTAAANTYEQTLKSEIAKSEPPTIFHLNGPVGYESWKQYCADMKDSKLYSYLTDKNLAITSGDGVYGIPFVIEGYGIIYNNAIMDKYFKISNREVKLNSAEEIKSFEELKSVVADMTKHKKELGIDGVFASTSLGTGQDWRWQTHLSNIMLCEEFLDNAPDADPAMTALNAKEVEFRYSKQFKNIFDLYTNYSVTDKKLLSSKSVADSMAEFALGRVAMVQNGTWAWSQIDGVQGNTVKAEDIKYLPIYCGLEDEETQGLCVGTESYIAVNSKVSEEKQKASFDFLDWLYSSETGKRNVSEELKFITPFNTFTEDETPEDPLSKELFRWINKEGIRTIPWAFTGYPSENFKTAFGNALLEYVQGTKTFSEVSDTVKNTWKEERK